MLGGKVASRWYQVGIVLESKVSDLEDIRIKKDLSYNKAAGDV